MRFGSILTGEIDHIGSLAMSDLLCFLLAFLAFASSAAYLESRGLLRRPDVPDPRARRRRAPPPAFLRQPWPETGRQPTFRRG